MIQIEPILNETRDYYKAMQIVLQRTQAQEENEDEGENMDLPELS
jgi:hypothetical protein